jgi:hypothetical protein
MLAKKEAHLEGQQQKLLAWAAELQRREAQLTAAVQQGAPASPAPAGSSGVPQPIPSDSPLLAGRSLSPMQPAASPQLRRTLGEAGLAAQAAAAQQGMLTPTAAAPSSGGAGEESVGGEGTVPATPAGPGEWTEEFEEVTAALPMLRLHHAAMPAVVCSLVPCWDVPAVHAVPHCRIASHPRGMLGPRRATTRPLGSAISALSALLPPTHPPTHPLPSLLPAGRGADLHC